MLWAAAAPGHDPIREAVLAIAAVLPFRVNSYVLDELIDWAAVPADPIFRLTFPQPDMLPAEDLAPVIRHMRQNAAQQVQAEAQAIRSRLNPHPAGQTDVNVPHLNGVPVHGLQQARSGRSCSGLPLITSSRRAWAPGDPAVTCGPPVQS
jgi:hypothetical protein